tara:strand:- start:1155 stop:1829 length:675 start_codon:yes stop_codon:yes gene_type:complete
MKAMILAAGRGKRMGLSSLKKPKPLAEINGMPLIEYNLIRVANAGIKEVIINLSWLGDQIKSYLGNGEKWNINITYLDEGDCMLGTGGGILNALSILGEDPFWLLNADVYTDYELRNNYKMNDDILAHLVLVKNPAHNPQGDFSLANKKVISNLEQNKKNTYTYSGISVISSMLFEGIIEEVFELGSIFKDRANDGFISGEFFNGLWFDVGSKERLDLLNNTSF